MGPPPVCLEQKEHITKGFLYNTKEADTWGIQYIAVFLALLVTVRMNVRKG